MVAHNNDIDNVCQVSLLQALQQTSDTLICQMQCCQCLLGGLAPATNYASVHAYLVGIGAIRMARLIDFRHV